jgi:hypothetical protein
LKDADIDLGEGGSKVDLDHWSADDAVRSVDFDEQVSDSWSQATPVSDGEVELFDFDGTFENDRYDLPLDVDESWVDIDLDDKRAVVK